MSKAAASLFVFGLYLIGLGVLLVLAPDALLNFMGLPAPRDVWIRVVGTLVLVLALYSILAARRDLTDFIRWTVYGRSLVVVILLAFVLLGLASPVLILFAIVDSAGAVWTSIALRSATQHA